MTKDSEGNVYGYGNSATKFVASPGTGICRVQKHWITTLLFTALCIKVPAYNYLFITSDKYTQNNNK